MNEIIDLLNEILNKIPEDIDEKMNEIINLLKKENRTIDKINEKEKFYYDSIQLKNINDIKFSELSSLKSCVMLSFKRRDLLSYLKNHSIEENDIVLIENIRKPADICEIICECDEKKWIVIDSDLIPWDNETIRNILNLISINQFVFSISLKQIKIDLPIVNPVIICGLTDWSVPNKILKEADKCFVNIGSIK